MQHHPPPPTPEALLEHLDWVRRLARGLVADPNAAEDLVQETWLSAARRPPRSGNLRNWLATVVRNAARERGRKESRRARHEALAARTDAVASSSELADRVATQQLVVQHVLELDEPYRETVLLRYFEDLAPGEIAERMGVPLATVKTRLRRALAELRTRLDRANGGDGRLWIAALMPLAEPPATLGTGTLILMSTKTIAWTTAAVIAFAALGLYFVQRDGETRRSQHVVAPLVALAGTDEPLIAPEPGRAGRGDALVTADADAPRVAPSSVQRMIVVDGATGSPVPGAEVWTIEADWNGWHARSTDREEHARTSGTRRTADARGEIALPVLEHAIGAVARSGSTYAERTFVPDGSAVVRLELRPDTSVRVQVVDAAGQPRIDVPIALRSRTSDERPRLGPVHMSARTRAPDGIAVLAHVLQRAPDLANAAMWGVVGVDGVFVPPVYVDFDPRHPPVAPLQLVLPPAGRLVVIVQDARGRPIGDTWVLATPVVHETGVQGREVPGQRTDLLARLGRAEFAHVGLGLELLVETRPSHELPPIEARVAGPTKAGEEVAVTLQLGEPYPVLTGRFVGASGPIAGGESISGRIELDRAGRESEEHPVHGVTDASGRFRIPIPTTCEAAVRARVHVRIGEGQSTVSSADIMPREPLKSGDIDVGDVLVAPPPVVLSGTVRDTDGEPIFWALVDVARMRAPDAPDGTARYEWMSGTRAMTDRAGRFTVSGVLPPGEYSAEVRAEGFVDSGLQPFVVGTRDREIVVEKYGALDGFVLLTDGISADRIVVDATARDPSPTQRAWGGSSGRVLPNGTFHLPAIPPGSVDVRVRLEGETIALASIDAVVIPAGGDSTDARLRPVDLGELVQRQIVITIVGPDREAVASAAVAIRPAGESAAPARRILCEDGQLTIPMRSSAVDLEIDARGMRSTRLEGVSADQTIVMEAGIPITVKLPADLVLPTAPIELALVLCPSSIDDSSLREPLYRESGGQRHEYYSWFIGQAPRFGAGREVDVHFPEAGAYRVNWMVAEGTVGTHATRFVRESRGGQELRVLESDAGKVFDLAPGAAELAEAIAGIRSR